MFAHVNLFSGIIRSSSLPAAFVSRERTYAECVCVCFVFKSVNGGRERAYRHKHTSKNSQDDHQHTKFTFRNLFGCEWDCLTMVFLCAQKDIRLWGGCV